EGEPILEALVTGAPLLRISNVLPRHVEQVESTAPISALVEATLHKKRRTNDARSAVELDSLSVPSYHLIDLERYEKALSYAYNQRRQGVLVTSRGCPFSCTYCFQISNAPARLQSAERVVKEIAHLHREFQIDDFYFVDDLFNLNRKRALQVFERLVAEKLNVRLYFVNGLRVDLCDEEFIDRMVEAGTVWVTYAIESACPRIQTLIRKKIELDSARGIINYTQRQGIVVNVNTMFGFPTETPAEAQMTLDYLGSLDHPSLLPYHFNLRGYPGCEIVDQAEQSGWRRDAFLATGFSSYGDLPAGSPTFTRREMMQHMLTFHERFGLANREHLKHSVQTLRRIGYSDVEILDMYTVLMNRRVHAIDELIAPKPDSAPSVWA
ncbi:MAG TPA: radical SAM protein, partial [Polyangiaceae bacterium]